MKPNSYKPCDEIRQHSAKGSLKKIMINHHLRQPADEHDLDRFFSGTTEEKIMVMEELYARYRETLSQDQDIAESLELLTEYGQALAHQMLAMDMDKLCCACATHEEGGCCSSYMEANSDVILLLINRLQGVSVCRQHKRPDECCFLGHSGCILPVKPIFCLNYNCKHIHDQSSKEAVNTLERLAGKLLTEQTRLESLVLQKIKNSGETRTPAATTWKKNLQKTMI